MMNMDNRFSCNINLGTISCDSYTVRECSHVFFSRTIIIKVHVNGFVPLIFIYLCTATLCMFF